KPLLRCERSERVCVLLCEWQFPAEAMECSSMGEGSSQGETVRERIRARERLLAPLQRLLWIAQTPQNLGHPGSAVHSGVEGVEKGKGRLALGIIESDPSLQVCPRGGQLAKSDRGHAHHMVSLGEEGGIVRTLGHLQELRGHFPCQPRLPAGEI